MGRVRGKLTPEQLARKAIVYVRQSTDEQVRANTGSTDYQRSQVRIAEDLGFPRERIEVVEDPGLSGSDAACRPGYLYIKEEMGAGRVGAILASDQTRLSRDAIEGLGFHRLARNHGVAVVLDGRVIDLDDPNDRFMQDQMALLGEHENRMRRANMQKGVIAKLEKGIALSAPPAGYFVDRPTRAWKKDEDPAVRQAIRAVFDAFLQARSILGTVRVLSGLGVKLPRQSTGKPVTWIDPAFHAVQQILTNPAYRGIYVYGRRRGDPRLPRDRRGRLRQRRVAEGMTIIPGHHEPYITEDEWHEIETTLAANSWKKSAQAPVSNGESLLHSIVRCGGCGQGMQPNYKSKNGPDRGAFAYACMGDAFRGGKACMTSPGRLVDRAVREALFDRLTPPSMAALEEAWRQHQSDADTARNAQRLALDQRRGEVADLEHRLLRIDPTLTFAYDAVARRLNEANQQLTLAEQAFGRPAKAALDAKRMAELCTLAERVESIWNSPSTENRDRQALTRLLVRRVQIERTRETISIRIEWTDGVPVTEISVHMSGYSHRLIDAWAAQGVSPDVIAARLREQGVRTQRNTPWTAHAVRTTLRRKRPEPAQGGAHAA